MKCVNCKKTFEPAKPYHTNCYDCFKLAVKCATCNQVSYVSNKTGKVTCCGITEIFYECIKPKPEKIKQKEPGGFSLGMDDPNQEQCIKLIYRHTLSHVQRHFLSHKSTWPPYPAQSLHSPAIPIPTFPLAIRMPIILGTITANAILIPILNGMNLARRSILSIIAFPLKLIEHLPIRYVTRW